MVGLNDLGGGAPNDDLTWALFAAERAPEPAEAAVDAPDSPPVDEDDGSGVLDGVLHER